MLITNDGRDIVSASQRRQYEDAETEAAQLNPVIDFTVCASAFPTVSCKILFHEQWPVFWPFLKNKGLAYTAHKDTWLRLPFPSPFLFSQIIRWLWTFFFNWILFVHLIKCFNAKLAYLWGVFFDFSETENSVYEKVSAAEWQTQKLHLHRDVNK